MFHYTTVVYLEHAEYDYEASSRMPIMPDHASLD